MISALVSGELPDPIPIRAPQEEPSSGLPQAQTAPDLADSDTAAGDAAAKAAGAAERDGDAGLVDDSESFGELPLEVRPSAASVSFGGAGAAGEFSTPHHPTLLEFTLYAYHTAAPPLKARWIPLHVNLHLNHALCGDTVFETATAYADAAMQCSGARSPRRAEQQQEAPGEQVHPPHRPPQAGAVAPAAKAAAVAGKVQLRWVGDPQEEPPLGICISRSGHRSFYGAIAKVQPLTGHSLGCIALGC